jgi:hypothetical protein
LHRGEHWYVVVTADDERASLLAYDSRLRRTEDEIQQEEGLKVMLLPLLPPEDEMEFEMPVLWALREYGTEVIRPAEDAGKKERENDHG